MRRCSGLNAVKAGSQYDAKQCVALRRLRVDACRKHDARIDSDPLFAFPCVAIFRNGLMRVMVSMAARNDLA